jgi:hypothetical protein
MFNACIYSPIMSGDPMSPIVFFVLFCADTEHAVVGRSQYLLSTTLGSINIATLEVNISKSRSIFTLTKFVRFFAYAVGKVDPAAFFWHALNVEKGGLLKNNES